MSLGFFSYSFNTGDENDEIRYPAAVTLLDIFICLIMFVSILSDEPLDPITCLGMPKIFQRRGGVGKISDLL